MQPSETIETHVQREGTHPSLGGIPAAPFHFGPILSVS